MVGADTVFTLFVDDASSLLDNISRTCERIGAKNFATASSADDAWRVLASKPVTHVVSDLRMPNTRGNDFLRQVKSRNADVQCTLLTGFHEDLSTSDVALLRGLGITIAPKTDLDTAWLAAAVGVQYAPEPSDDVSPSAPASQSVSLTDEVATLRLELNNVREELRRNRNVVLELASDLLDELSQYGDVNAKTIVGSGSSMSVADIIGEIINLTPTGVRFIELDRAVRRRFRK